MDKLKDFLNAPLKRNAATHGWLLMAVGAYLVYMAWGMIQNTKNGLSSMSMPLTAVLAALMALAGLAVVAYGAWMLYRVWQQEKNNYN